MTVRDLADKLVERFVDHTVGPIRRLWEAPRYPGTGRMIVVNAEFVAGGYFGTGADHTIPGGTRSDSGNLSRRYASGAAFQRDDAVLRAVCEALERQCASVYCRDELVFAKEAELDGAVYPVNRMVGYTSHQYRKDGFEIVRYDRDVRRHWVLGRNLTSGAATWIPSLLVWMVEHDKEPAEVISQSVSTGLATGSSVQKAIEGGLCEVIERDSFICTWLMEHPTKRLPRAVTNDLLSPHALELMDIDDLNVGLYHLISDMPVPTFLACVASKERGATTVGAAAHFDVELAAEKAVIEAFHSWAWGQEMVRRRRTRITHSEVRGFEDHVRYYLEREHEKNLANFLQEPETEQSVRARLADRASSVRATIEAMDDLGYEVFAVNLTRDDIGEAGLHVVRVLVPGLHPLHCGTTYHCLDRRRIRAMAERCGATVPRRLNTRPHPFP